MSLWTLIKIYYVAIIIKYLCYEVSHYSRNFIKTECLYKQGLLMFGSDKKYMEQFIFIGRKFNYFVDNK